MAISTVKNFSRKTINVILIFLLTLSLRLTLSLSEIKNKKKNKKKKPNGPSLGLFEKFNLRDFHLLLVSYHPAMERTLRNSMRKTDKPTVNRLST